VLQDFNLYNLVLGPVSQEEATAYLKKELQLSLGEMQRIIETAGRYPLFLRVAAMYVKAQIAEDRHYELTEVTAEGLKEWLYGKRAEGGLYEDYEEIWDSLNREEQRILYRLVEEPWLVVEDDEVAKSLAKNKGVIDRPFGSKTIPTAFADFIRGTPGFAPTPTHERLLNLLWPLRWDRSRTISAMFVLLIFYAISTPIVLNWPRYSRRVCRTSDMFGVAVLPSTKKLTGGISEMFRDLARILKENPADFPFGVVGIPMALAIQHVSSLFLPLERSQINQVMFVLPVELLGVLLLIVLIVQFAIVMLVSVYAFDKADDLWKTTRGKRLLLIGITGVFVFSFLLLTIAQLPGQSPIQQGLFHSLAPVALICASFTSLSRDDVGLQGILAFVLWGMALTMTIGHVISRVIGA
jgi:hypothetical protein